MKRSLLIVIVAGITVSAGAWLFAQSAKAPPVGDDLLAPKQDKRLIAPSTAKPDDFASTPQLKTTTVEAINLRNQFIELSKKKAQLMKEPQLKREIEALEREIPELEAWAKAQEAVQILREVIEKHPNTKAAESANAAIQLIEARGAQATERIERRPTPETDRQFRRSEDPGFPDPDRRPHAVPFGDAPGNPS
jgi:hypothetical protein